MASFPSLSSTPSPMQVDAASMSNENAFAAAIHRIIRRVAMELTRDAHPTAASESPSDGSTPSGPLTPQDLQELGFLCTAASSNVTSNDNHPNSIAAEVENEQLSALVELLDRHVNAAVDIKLIAESLKLLEEEAPSRAMHAIDKWFSAHGHGRARLIQLRMGLEAAAIVIQLGNRVSEDAINAAITLMRMHLQNHVVPAMNQTGHLQKSSMAAGDTTTNSTKKRKRSDDDGPSSTTSSKELKKVYKYILQESVAPLLSLMDRLEQLVYSCNLDDQQVLLLSGGCLSTMTLSESGGGSTAEQLQLATIAICKAAFGRYPAHRDVFLDDLFPVWLATPTDKRSLRGCKIRYSAVSSHPQSLFQLNRVTAIQVLAKQDVNVNHAATDRHHSIQMMTNLVLQLIQASVTQPSYKQQQTQEGVVTYSSGLSSCQAVAYSIANKIFYRCTHSKGGAAEFRPVLVHLVEDLLMLLLVPQYPAAELLLMALLQGLMKVKASSEALYVTAAFDAFGKIGSVMSRILAVAKERSLGINTAARPDGGNAGFDCVYCSQAVGAIGGMACHTCGKKYHSACIGSGQPDQLQAEEWMCDACRLTRIATRENRKYQHSVMGAENNEARNDAESEAAADEDYAMHHAFQAALAHRLGAAAELRDATRFHLARWIDGLESNGTAVRRSVAFGLLEHWDRPGPTGEPLTEEGFNRVLLWLTTKSLVLFKAFRIQMGFLVKLMTEGASSRLRTLSLKAIEKTVEGDPNLMLYPIITKAVSRRLTDEAISVREAAVSLVGSYVVHSPAVANSFHSALVLCLSDVGISVRKRAIKIFNQVLVSHPTYKGRSAICAALLQRAVDPKEEEKVADLIEELFHKLWLEDGGSPIPGRRELHGAPSTPEPRSEDNSSSPISQSASGPEGTISTLVTPTPPAQANRATARNPARRVDLAAEQMMEVVRAAGTNKHLSTLLKKLLGDNDSLTVKGKKLEDRKKRQKIGLKQCEQLVRSLFELLITVEEQRSVRGSRIGKDVAATIQTIVVFSDQAPRAVFQNLDTILPYLKADNGVSMVDEALIIEAACDVITRLADSELGSEIAERLSVSTVAGDLVQITYKFGSAAFAAAIRAQASVTRVAGEDSNFRKKSFALAETFYKHLYKKRNVDDFSSTDEKTRRNTHRALEVLGLICHYHNPPMDTTSWDNEVARENEPLLSSKELTWSNMTLSSYRMFSKYLGKRDSPTRCAALRALGGIFVSHPRLMLQLDQVGLIGQVMSEDATVPLQLEALQCWQNILIAEERRVDEGYAAAKMNSDENVTLSKRICGDQDSDANLFGGVLTSHADRLFDLMHAQDSKVRLAALELLGVLLRQGLVNPNEAVPHLFGLQGDVDDSAIRTLALKLLMAEGEKRPEILRQRICAGVKRAFEFQRGVYGNGKQVSAVVTVARGGTSELQCIFASVFLECIASIRKQRQGLFKNLLGLFEVQETLVSPSSRRRSKGRKSDDSTDLSLLSFASQILAHLPYATAGDPLFIIHSIGSIITLQGAQLIDNFAAVLRPVGLASGDELDENNTAEDALETAARSKFPSRTKEAAALGSSKFDQYKFLELCRRGMGLALLLRLKSFLRRLYNLSETRILEYDPSSKDSEKGISKASFTKPFDASVPVSLLQKDGPIDKDSLIRQYAEFRRLMREENSFDAPAVDSEGEESAEPVATPAEDTSKES